MKPGDVRVPFGGKQLLLVLRESPSPWPRYWDCLDLETGRVERLGEKWLIHDTREWNG